VPVEEGGPEWGAGHNWWDLAVCKRAGDTTYDNQREITEEGNV